MIDYAKIPTVELEQKIDELRIDLNSVSQTNGFRHAKVVAIMEELDVLISESTRRKLEITLNERKEELRNEQSRCVR